MVCLIRRCPNTWVRKSTSSWAPAAHTVMWWSPVTRDIVRTSGGIIAGVSRALRATSPCKVPGRLRRNLFEAPSAGFERKASRSHRASERYRGEKQEHGPQIEAPDQKADHGRSDRGADAQPDGRQARAEGAQPRGINLGSVQVACDRIGRDENVTQRGAQHHHPHARGPEEP